MGMPKFPDGKDRPNKQQVIIDLLESVALEEMAAAHLLNAEGEKLQAVVQKYTCNQINYCDMEQVWSSAQRMINSLIMNQWLLINKLSLIPEKEDLCFDGDETCPWDCCDPCSSVCPGECRHVSENCNERPDSACCKQNESERQLEQTICECEHPQHPSPSECHTVPENCCPTFQKNSYAKWCKDCALWDKCTNPDKCPKC